MISPPVATLPLPPISGLPAWVPAGQAAVILGCSERTCVRRAGTTFPCRRIGRGVGFPVAWLNDFHAAQAVDPDIDAEEHGLAWIAAHRAWLAAQQAAVERAEKNGSE